MKSEITSPIDHEPCESRSPFGGRIRKSIATFRKTTRFLLPILLIASLTILAHGLTVQGVSSNQSSSSGLCALPVPTGGSISLSDTNQSIVIAPDGSVHAYSSQDCLTKHSLPVLPNINGWIEGAQSSQAYIVTYIAASEYVPAAPTDTSNNPIIFLWPAIQADDASWIVQPVLAYGCDGYWLFGSCQGVGGAYWWISAFAVQNGHAGYTTPIQVSTGDNILGYVSYQTGTQNCALGNGYWIFIDDNSNGQSAGECLLSNSSAHSAYLMLEADNISACAQLPNQSSEQFLSVASTPALVWSPDPVFGGSPNCSYSTSAGPTTIHVHSYPTTDTYSRSHGMSKNAVLPNPWWPPYYSSSKYVIQTTGSAFDYYWTDTYNNFSIGSNNYVKEAASGFCPSYCWHSQIYVSGALNTQADVDRSTPVTATFTVNSWTVYWTP